MMKKYLFFGANNIVRNIKYFSSKRMISLGTYNYLFYNNVRIFKPQDSCNIFHNIYSTQVFNNNFSMQSLSSRNYSSEEIEEIEDPLGLFNEEDEEMQLVPRSLRTGSTPHQVLIIHPHIKWGPNKKHDRIPELEMEEAESLIGTLNEWKIIDTKKISLLSYDSHTFFTSGQLETVEKMVKENELISALFINVKSLKLGQHLFLEKLLNIPIFDRYSIVINIFKRHAISKEAKLQVALAEIPFIRSRLRGINEMNHQNFTKDISIGSCETYLVKRLKALSFFEQKLKRSLMKLRKNRELLRSKRKSLQFPIVAVIGYTNAGKTSLIKCLTEEERMQPEDKLFATLDVTVHAGVLPSHLKVLYVDTIGFISDIPTNLLEPFIATLEDAIQADLIVHVQDISHPNYLKQKSHVLETLKNLNLDDKLLDTIISVANKCDKADNLNEHSTGSFLVSCTKQVGLEDLETVIEQALVKNLELQQLRIKVENGGKEYQWLQKEAAVANYSVDENDQQFIFLDVTITKSKLEKFKHYFIRQ